jgi:ribose 5-phosphate isomerase B
MKIAVACDHGGYPLKQAVLEQVRTLGCEPVDLGAMSASPSDYPDYAEKVGHALQAGEVQRGILLWFGLGMYCGQ